MLGVDGCICSSYTIEPGCVCDACIEENPMQGGVHGLLAFKGLRNLTEDFKQLQMYSAI